MSSLQDTDTAPMFLMFCTELPVYLIAIVNDEISAIEAFEHHVELFRYRSDHSPHIRMTRMPVDFLSNLPELIALIQSRNKCEMEFSRGDSFRLSGLSHDIYEASKDLPNLFRLPPKLKAHHAP